MLSDELTHVSLLRVALQFSCRAQPPALSVLTPTAP
jgi:hypothetical protein